MEGFSTFGLSTQLYWAWDLMMKIAPKLSIIYNQNFNTGLMAWNNTKHNKKINWLP